MTLGQSRPGSNGNEWVLQTPQHSRNRGLSIGCSLMSYPEQCSDRVYQPDPILTEWDHHLQKKASSMSLSNFHGPSLCDLSSSSNLSFLNIAKLLKTCTASKKKNNCISFINQLHMRQPSWPTWKRQNAVWSVYPQTIFFIHLFFSHNWA